MKVTLYIPDITCESCVRLISRKFKSLQGINSFTVLDDSIKVEYDESLIKPEHMVQVVQNAGFRASVDPFERKTFRERIRHIKENRSKYEVELTGIMYLFYAFFILVGLEILAYYGFLRTIPSFLDNYLWWIFYLDVSVVTLGFALWHFLSYRAKITCMTGMMIGMTFGMQAGMMLGAVLGATNGFFVGAMVGMLVGVAIGILTGRCCGIMGIMQGMMAGIMGGTMGPMIILMMFADHLLLFMPVYMAINVAILGGFSYMMIEEVVEGKEVSKTPIDFWTFVSGCVLVVALFIAIMVYGPPSVLVG